ncbi:hypothetical protein [Baaleninema sp.]|uniref:hypothetical protein n=1 Tax=Baaleninema sp. TaxID=3101197 RepID=UPI003D035597
MDLKVAISIADRLLYERTGQHLDDVQLGIIGGVLNHKSYADIAETLHRSEGHVKDVGYELWQQLSDSLGEAVNKGNLRSALVRHAIVSGQFVGLASDRGIGNKIHTINLCSPSHNSSALQGAEEQARSKLFSKLRRLNLTNEQIAEILETDVTELEDF